MPVLPAQPASLNKLNAWPVASDQLIDRRTGGQAAVVCRLFREKLEHRVPGAREDPMRATPDDVGAVLADVQFSLSHAKPNMVTQLLVACGLRAAPQAFIGTPVFDWARYCYEAAENKLDSGRLKTMLQETRGLRSLAQLWKENGCVTWNDGCAGFATLLDPARENKDAAFFWKKSVAPFIGSLALPPADDGMVGENRAVASWFERHAAPGIANAARRAGKLKKRRLSRPKAP